MIIIVAPYSPINGLAGSKKIEAIISILSELNLPLVLVNSAHNDNEIAPISTRKLKVAAIDLIEITPPTSSSRVIGKFKNIFQVNQVIEKIKQLGDPQLFWFYNGYAFEMSMALKAQRVFNVSMIFEFEDWHFSRSRGLNPKPFIDYWFWRKAAKKMRAAFVVNAFLADKMRDFVEHIELLPGVVPKKLVNIAITNPPFSSKENQNIDIGFFGGLCVEKGADIVLQLAEVLPQKYTLHVTGSGILDAEFLACSKNKPEKLHYYGLVDDTTLYQLIAKCDVILNPHSSIEDMGNGVFPFKVVEAIASGRLLISTTVPARELEDVLIGVQFVEHSVDAFQSAIFGCKQRYLQYAALIAQGAFVANERFGENALLEKVQLLFKELRRR